MTDNSPTIAAAASPSDAQIVLSLPAEQVRRLIATGAIDLANLSLGGAAWADAALGDEPAGPSSNLVPGERIKLSALAETALTTLAGKSTLRTYGPYIRFLAFGWAGDQDAGLPPYPGLGDKWVDEVLPSQLEVAERVVQARAKARADVRADSRRAAGRYARATTNAGRAARYNAVGAWRFMFKIAVKDRHLARAFDPSREVDKVGRIDGTRVALEQAQLDEVWAVVINTGDDPDLDQLIVEIILIAGARREGILNLTVDGIDEVEVTLRLDEKNGKVVHQPVPEWFLEKVIVFAASRGATRPGDRVFRKRAGVGRPVTDLSERRFDNLFADRIQARLAWADKEQLTAHSLRHHGITVIERTSSHAVSVAFARHEPEGVNGRYTIARPQEVAAAVIAVYGGDHPWLYREPRPRTD